MKLLAINGSPRKKWNTAQLLEQVVAGAASGGAQARLEHLRDLDYSGCVSCFHCKDPQGKSYGRCVLKDDLRGLLDEVHEADVLVLGTPFYFSTETALTRAFLERLWFQYFLYTHTKPPLSPRKKAVALLYTMNVKEEAIVPFHKDVIIDRAKYLMETLFAPTEVFLCTDTKQVKDYSKYEVDIWDTAAKDRRHEEVFPQDLARAFDLGARLVAE